VSVLRGTFRLSLVVALLVAAYFGITAHVAAQNDVWEDWKIWNTLRCGALLGSGHERLHERVRADRHWQGGLLK
jgi:hypothetical protein